MLIRLQFEVSFYTVQAIQIWKFEVGLGIPNLSQTHMQFGFSCVTMDSHGELIKNSYFRTYKI